MRLRDIAIGILLAGLLAAGVALTMPAPQAVGPAPPAPPAVLRPVTAPAPRAVAAPSAVPSATPLPLPAPAASAGTQWQRGQAAFNRAQNLREFFYEALRQPQDGTLYFAIQALSACERVLEQDLAALPALRRQAAVELQRRCDFTPEGLQDAQRELRAARLPDAGIDGVMGPLSRYLGADGEGRASLLGAAFAQGDPAIVSLLAAAAVVQNMPPQARGMPFGPTLVDCRLGAECGPEAIRTLELCIGYGWCAGSVPASLQQGLGQEFAVLDTVATQVARDMRGPGS